MLINELQRCFGPQVFDASDVVGRAYNDQHLAHALDAEVAHARYKHTGILRTNAVRMWLRQAKPVIAVTRHNYWSFRIGP